MSSFQTKKEDLESELCHALDSIELCMLKQKWSNIANMATA